MTSPRAPTRYGTKAGASATRPHVLVMQQLTVALHATHLILRRIDGPAQKSAKTVRAVGGAGHESGRDRASASTEAFSLVRRQCCRPRHCRYRRRLLAAHRRAATGSSRDPGRPMTKPGKKCAETGEQRIGRACG